MPHRDFDADGFTVDADDLLPESGPTFTLAGETFHVLPVMPGGAYVMLPDSINPEAAARFIRRCLVPEDEQRFIEALLSRTHVFQLWPEGGGRHRLIEIVDWLLDADGGGLTPFAASKPAPSPNGESPTEGTSTASSSARESTPAG